VHYAARCPPAAHHSNDLVPLPAVTLPDDDAILRNGARPPPRRAITAGGCVERALIALPLITLGETAFVDVAHSI